MKKFKILLSMMLVCAMFLPNVSAYYSLESLEINNDPSVVRYPMYTGTYVSLHSKKKILYRHFYDHFLEIYFSQYPVTCGSHARTLQNIYEDETRHIGACAYATALFLKCEDDEALKFSAGVVKLSNSLIGYPKNFDEKLLVFAANYVYALLGNLFKEGNHSDVNAHGLYKFSELAYIDSSTYCQMGWEFYGHPIPEKMFEECIPQ